MLCKKSSRQTLGLPKKGLARTQNGTEIEKHSSSHVFSKNSEELESSITLRYPHIAQYVEEHFKVDQANIIVKFPENK